MMAPRSAQMVARGDCGADLVAGMLRAAPPSDGFFGATTTYMGAVKDVDFDDEEYMFERSQGFLVGDPDHCIEHVQRYVDMGVDALVLRVDSLPHEQLLRSIELFGKYVIPHFKHPRNVVRPADDVLADIRAARPAHEEALRKFQAEQNLLIEKESVR